MAHIGPGAPLLTARYFGSHPRDTICIDLPMHTLTFSTSNKLPPSLTLFAPYRSTQNKWLYLLFSLVSKVSLSLLLCRSTLFSLEHSFLSVYTCVGGCDDHMGYICMFVVIVG